MLSIINIQAKELGLRLLLLGILAAFLHPSLSLTADAKDAPVRYKKQTVVDFEDALIEGKSRKPYSAYLSKQKDEEMRGYFDWDLDWQRRVRLSTDGAKYLK